METVTTFQHEAEIKQEGNPSKCVENNHTVKCEPIAITFNLVETRQIKSPERDQYAALGPKLEWSGIPETLPEENDEELEHSQYDKSKPVTLNLVKVFHTEKEKIDLDPYVALGPKLEWSGIPETLPEENDEELEHSQYDKSKPVTLNLVKLFHTEKEKINLDPYVDLGPKLEWSGIPETLPEENDEALEHSQYDKSKPVTLNLVKRFHTENEKIDLCERNDSPLSNTVQLVPTHKLSNVCSDRNKERQHNMLSEKSNGLKLETLTSCSRIPETFPEGDNEELVLTGKYESNSKVTSLRHLKNIQHTHSREEAFICDVCNKSFSRKDNLQTHLLTHTGEKAFKCNVCNKAFSHSGTLTNHRLTHTREKAFKCDVCKKTFSRKHILERHLLTHTGEKTFKCYTCNKTFSQKSSLKTHLLTHTGVKPYKCDICDKTFSRRGFLKIHLLTHTGERAFKCDVCNKSFSRRDNLKSHLVTHTREKVFKCNV